MNSDYIDIYDISSYEWKKIFIANNYGLKFSKNKRHYVDNVDSKVMTEFTDFLIFQLGIESKFRQKEFQCILKDNTRFFEVVINTKSDFFCLIDFECNIHKISTNDPLYEKVKHYEKIMQEKARFEELLVEKHQKNTLKI